MDLKSRIKETLISNITLQEQELILRKMLYVILFLEPIFSLKPTDTYCLAVCLLGKSCSPQRAGSHCCVRSLVMSFSQTPLAMFAMIPLSPLNLDSQGREDQDEVPSKRL